MTIASLGGGVGTSAIQDVQPYAKIRSSQKIDMIKSYDPDAEAQEIRDNMLKVQNPDGSRSFSISKVVAQRALELLTRADTDHDGIVTPEEMKALKKSLEDQRKAKADMDCAQKIAQALETYKGAGNNKDTKSNPDTDIQIIGDLERALSDSSGASSGSGINIGELAKILNG